MSKMRNAVRLLRTSPISDIALLALICLIAARGWFNSGLPLGHDAIGVIYGADAVKNFFLGYNGMEVCSAQGALGAFALNPPLIHFPLIVLSIPFTWAVAAKLLFLLLLILSTVSVYFYVHLLTRSRAASFVAGLAYIFTPYYLLEVVFEGHWTIGAAYMLTPLVFLTTEKALQHPKTTTILLAGIVLGLLIVSGQPQSFPILFGPFWAIYVVFRISTQPKSRITLAAATCLSILAIGLSLTAFWWLPLLKESAYFHASYILRDADPYTANLIQATALRPILCCSPPIAYGVSTYVPARLLQLLPFVLALLGIVLNLRNKYVWFFSVSIIMTFLLAMGPASPINIFGFAHNHWPMFSYMRTPVRFLLFSTLAYAVLIGFCVMGLMRRLESIKIGNLGTFNLTLVAPILITLVLLGNTWQEARAAFNTFDLPSAHSGALDFLAEQPAGDYLIADSSFGTEAHLAQGGNILSPTYWTFAHGKETLPGGMPETTTYASEVLRYLCLQLQDGTLNASNWFNILNVKYIVFDKTRPLSANMVLDEAFEQVWTSETIDIYENHSMKPRVFSFTNINQRVVPLYAASTINLAYAEGTQAAMLSLSSEHRLSQEFAVESTYQLTSPHDSLCLQTNINEVDFGLDDAIHLTFYSHYDLPDVHVTLALLEQDGSRYEVVPGSVEGIKAGWSEINLPISLLSLGQSTDENNRLDLEQIDALWIGVAKQGDSSRSNEFELYFDKLSVVSHQANDNLQYTKIRPGKYEVHVNSDSPSYLVLSESYHPNWVARIEGKDIHSQIMYECLNGFYLEPGEYDITLEFVNSRLRTAGNLISGITLSAICCVAVFLMLRARRRKASAQQHVDGSGDPAA